MAGRRSGFHIQPENVGPEPAEYWGQDEAKRYHGTPKASLIQAELTHSVISLGDLHKGPGVVLDLGAGGGLSTLSFQALVADASTSGPPFVIGVDASPAMLATISSRADVTGISLPAISGLAADISETAQKRVNIVDGIKWCRARSDILLADLAQPLPFRRNIADGILSVSAVQWLLDERPRDSEIQALPAGEIELAQQKQSLAEDGVSNCTSSAINQSLSCPDGVHLGSQLRLRRLFHCLREIIVPTANLAFQFYPPKGDHDFGARALTAALLAEGFHAEVVLDFPHKGAAKKWVLVAQVSDDSSNGKACYSSSRPWCALCWPVVAARCALQVGSRTSVSCQNSDVQARLRHQHFELALRLIRQGRRLIASQDSMESTESCKIRQRLEQELHPLQRSLACALAALLARPGDAEASEAKKRKLGESANLAVECVGVAPNVGESPPEKIPPTRTQLREIVLERLDDVLSILHQAPDVSWTAPSPPLSALATDL